MQDTPPRQFQIKKGYGINSTQLGDTRNEMDLRFFINEQLKLYVHITKTMNKGLKLLDKIKAPSYVWTL